MGVQVLVVTMNQQGAALLEKMNIRSDVIVGNQCDINSIEEFDYRNKNVKFLNFAERGVGLNRNNTLMRADGDIVLFADDDVVYNDDYVEKVEAFYKENPNADVAIFNFETSRGDEPLQDIVTKTERINKVKARKYGTFCVSARRDSLRKANIYFHLLFGGGAKYSCGEDTIFLQDCFKAGLKVYTCKETLGQVRHGESTWFSGYNEKYFIDKGVLFYFINKKTAKIFALAHCLRYRKEYKDFGWKKAYKLIKRGIKEAKE